MAGSDPGDSHGRAGQGPAQQGVWPARRAHQEARGAHPHRHEDSGMLQLLFFYLTISFTFFIIRSQITFSLRCFPVQPIRKTRKPYPQGKIGS